MTLKTYAAMITGALAMVLTALLLWVGTQLPMQDVIAFALVAYYVGLVGAFAAIEQLQKRHRKDLGEPTIITLDRNEWKNGEEVS